MSLDHRNKVEYLWLSGWCDSADIINIQDNIILRVWFILWIESTKGNEETVYFTEYTEIQKKTNKYI